MSNVIYETMNLLVPAFGNTRCLQQNFPLAPANILDFNGVTIDDVPFYPQAVTIDATSLPDGESVTFEVLQIGYTRIVLAGQTETFNFPSIKNLKVRITTSDSISTTRAYFYNYPAFVDRSGAVPVQLSNSSVAVDSTPGPSAEQRTQFSRIFTGATSSGTLITAGTTETIKINSITVSKAALADVPTVLQLYQTGNTASSASLVMMPIGTVENNDSFVYAPQVPLILPLADDLLFAFSAAATITGNVCVTVDYELV